MQKYYTAKQVAEMLQVDINTISRWVTQKKLEVTKINKRNFRISQKQLDNYLNNQGGKEDDK